MKTLFHMLLFRPQGSTTWTPYPCQDRASGNFFTTSLAARAYARIHSKDRHFIHGTKGFVTLEFKVAHVKVEDLEPDTLDSSPKK
jgi:hypothetical protein